MIGGWNGIFNMIWFKSLHSFMLHLDHIRAMKCVQWSYSIVFVRFQSLELVLQGTRSRQASMMLNFKVKVEKA